MSKAKVRFDMHPQSRKSFLSQAPRRLEKGFLELHRRVEGTEIAVGSRSKDHRELLVPLEAWWRGEMHSVARLLGEETGCIVTWACWVQMVLILSLFRSRPGLVPRYVATGLDAETGMTSDK